MRGGNGAQVRLGVAAMDHDGALGLAGQLHLPDQYALLNLAWRVVVEVIEPNLTHGHHLGMPGECQDFLGVGIGEMAGIVRVHAHGGVNPIVTRGDGQRRIEAGGASAAGPYSFLTLFERLC